MIDFAVAVAMIVFIIAGRKIWQSYIIVASERTALWAKEAENNLQPEIKQVHDARKELVAKQGKWLTVDDIDAIK